MRMFPTGANYARNYNKLNLTSVKAFNILLLSLFKGMWAHTMTCLDYQDLIDRGWRRFVRKKACCILRN